jgi:hypothetical protein
MNMFGRLKNGELIKAPNKINHNGRIYHNPKDEVYIDAGYYPVIETEMPDMSDGKQYKQQYELVEGQIVQTWVEEEILEEEIIEEEIISEVVIQPSYKELVIMRIRERYSIDDEIAILRQRYAKPEEFEEYNNFVEKCKLQIKEEYNF